ncbi:MAG TPA: hypothetical protein VF753_10560 [Terriglobales bacterium]
MNPVAPQPRRSLRGRLLIFCAVASVLAAISFVNGSLVIAGFLAGLPLIVLAIAPDALLVGIALLIADIVAPPQVSRKVAFAFAIGGLAVALIAAAAWSNHQLDEQIRALNGEDREMSVPLAGTRFIAIQFVSVEKQRGKRRADALAPVRVRQKEDSTTGAVPPPAQKQFCEDLCLHLLFEKLADDVLVSSVTTYDTGSTPPDLEEVGMRFHLEQQRPCLSSAARTGGLPAYRALAFGTEPNFDGYIKDRISAGQCVVGEPARLADAAIILQLNGRLYPPPGEYYRPSAKNARQLFFPPTSATRLSIYQVQDGTANEVFRQTQVEAFPLLPVLLFGPVFTGEGGIGITEGLLRHHKVYSPYALRDVLGSKLGSDIVPLTR